ncbi:MAG: SDR family oxidoreductase [Planctomycetota bacterium]
MDEAALGELLKISHHIGEDEEYVQGGGGNTSVKSADGGTMLVKASGTSLRDMSADAGWVEMDVAATLRLLEAGLEKLDPAEREKSVLDGLHEAVVGGPGGRPSVESALHAQLGRAVIHTHPAAVNAITCGPGAEAAAELVEEGEKPPLWIPFAPGYLLAQAVRDGIAGYRREHGADPSVFFLENHGIFVAADTADQGIALHEDWVDRCEDYFAEHQGQLVDPKMVESPDLREVMAAARPALAAKVGRPAFMRFSGEWELVAAACTAAGGTLSEGALTPDQIVYCGSRAVLADTLKEAAEGLIRKAGEAGAPLVALVRETGALLVSDRAEKLDVVESVAACCARTVRMASGKGGARNLGPDDTSFIVGWEAEHYRQKLHDRESPELNGKVAVVTGAASGLGRGIAQGLVASGAAVAFCDIDRDGAAEAAGETRAPGRTLAVQMNVTGEDGVRRGFDRVVAHWGGVDVVVCAAGVAPPYNLVDFPLDEWRRALAINLTGYFLVAREAARIMKAQGQGGSMVLVSSKTGLEASKTNSAYNATKAGELHLARGWALELGADGIRVNAVAPGNVFEGSRIWNEEYIAKCAEKKGIKPEEVIPHYTSLTALGREIKRRDVAEAVIFLCSERARCVTGQVLVVDGGQVMAR